jgi:two-component system nitrogen regulation response regulator GlnG
LDEVRRAAPRAKLGVMTAHGSLDAAMKAVKAGAIEYLAKPVDLEKAKGLIEAATKPVPLSREVEKLRGRGAPAGAIVGTSAPMQEVFKKVAAVSASDANVLLVG